MRILDSRIRLVGYQRICCSYFTPAADLTVVCLCPQKYQYKCKYKSIMHMQKPFFRLTVLYKSKHYIWKRNGVYIYVVIFVVNNIQLKFVGGNAVFYFETVKIFFIYLHCSLKLIKPNLNNANAVFNICIYN